MNGPTRDRKIARLRDARRIWAVPAVHGEAARLMRLHDLIAVRTQPGDRVVYLGNYLGYGDEIAATIDELLDFRRRFLARPSGFGCDVVFLRGAQEEMWQKLLQLQFAPNPGAVLQWMVNAGVEATIRAYGGDLRQGLAATRDGPRTITRWTTALRGAMNAVPGHTTLFTRLRHAAMTDTGGLLFVHAAVEPSRELPEQGDAFWWGGYDILELAAPFAGFRRVVRGFDRSHRGVVETPFALSIDGGAGHGGPLLSACLDLEGSPIDTVRA